MKFCTAVSRAPLAVAEAGSATVPVWLLLVAKVAAVLAVPRPDSSRRLAASTVQDSGSTTGARGSLPVPSRSSGPRPAAESAPYGLAADGAGAPAAEDFWALGPGFVEFRGAW